MADKMFDSLVELDVLDLDEQPLTEDVLMETMTAQEVHDKFYPDIKIDTFNDILKIDPTYKEGSDKLGSYAKWLLTLYKKGQDLSDTKEIKDQLTIFNKTKNRLPADRRDINKYKDFKELMNYLAQNDVDNKSDFQLKSEAMKDVKFIAAGNGWEVYSPKSWEASKYLRGDDAVWCTGRHDDPYYFNHYVGSDGGNGTLYIFINQKSPTERYQAHYRKDRTSVNEFRNARNECPTTSHEYMVEILLKSGLVNALMNSELKDKEEVKEALKYKEYADGKPYIYVGDEGVTRMERYVITKIAFDPSCTSIASRAFEDCKKLKIVDIPNSIQSIGESAFRDCTSLVAMRLPDNLKSIPEMMCRGCTELVKVHIPDSVDSIGINAFRDCNKIKITAKKHKMTVRNADLEFLKSHLTFVGE